MIVIEDKLFSEQDCKKLIDIYNCNLDKVKKWYSSHVIRLDNLEDNDLLFTKKIVQIINNFCVSIFGINVYVERADITKWDVESSKNYHYDDARDSTILSSITYLNDDYEGGETFFENNLIISPEVGKSLFFDGNQYLHGVKTVYSNPRYTLAIWYTNDINQSLEW
jgi:hypothetical protein